MKRNDYSYEFEVYTDYIKEVHTPVWKELSEEEKEQFRMEFPDSPLVPTKVKVGEQMEEVVVRKDALCRRRVPNIRALTISEYMGPSGRLYTKRFLVQESPNVQYVVKGNYSEFKRYLDNLTKKSAIGYKTNLTWE